jgi:hypothetical protein
LLSCHCYSCSQGWLFNPKPFVNVNRKGFTAVSFAYLLLTVLPLVLVAVALLDAVTVYRIILLVGVF